MTARPLNNHVDRGDGVGECSDGQHEEDADAKEKRRVAEGDRQLAARDRPQDPRERPRAGEPAQQGALRPTAGRLTEQAHDGSVTDWIANAIHE